jgi:hypothetical protein
VAAQYVFKFKMRQGKLLLESRRYVILMGMAEDIECKLTNHMAVPH